MSPVFLIDFFVCYDIMLVENEFKNIKYARNY